MRLRLNVDRLALLLAASRLSQNHWALRLGLSRGHWSDIVNGRHPFPSVRTRERMLDVFGVAERDLFDVDAEPKPADVEFRLALAHRYTLTEELGHGGMGTVFLAHDRVLARLVALKAVTPEAAAGIGADQLLQEIAVVGRLQHPNILPLHDAGDAAGHPFYVMPYVRSGSLGALLRERARLPIHEVVALVDGIARGLAAAHERLVLHCDIKPENILVQDGHPYVMDFGIARKLHSESLEWAGERRELDFSAGTPAYVSPEQASGDAAIDQRSDVYSLACVTYELLTGRPPFGGRTTQEIVTLRFRNPPPDLREFAPEVPAAVVGAITRAMSLDPARRPAGAPEFAAELRTAAHSTSGVAAALSVRASRAARWVRARAGVTAPPRLSFPPVMIDLKQAFRTLFRTPFVTVVAVLSLALGIGANAAIFSLFDEILRRPLPVMQPDRLVNLSAPGPNPGSMSCGQAGDCTEVFSYRMFRDLEHASTGFSGVAAHVLFSANLAFNGETQNGDGLYVSGSYFPVLGLRPALGRLLGPEDDQAIGASFVTVLSYAYWTTQLGGSRAVLNQPIMVNGQSLIIVGVAPRGFDGTTLGTEPKMFVPVSMRGVVSGFTGFENRRSYYFYLFARLKPGVSIEQAKVAVNGAYHPIITEVEAPLQKGMSEQTMQRFKAKQVLLGDGSRGQSGLRRDTRRPILLLFSITAIVLLIACANIANLLLARGAHRAMEMAIRLSLGASRAQIVIQLLVESCLLAALGGAASLLVARWTLGAMTSLVPTQMSSGLQFALNGTAVLFAAALSLGTGLLFGLFPALHSTRTDIVNTLRDASGKHSGSRAAMRFRTSLVTAQIALAMALLVSAGLFVKSLRNVSRVDLGLKIDHIVTFQLSPDLNGYDSTRSTVLFARVEEELAAIPGVADVAAARVPLIADNSWGAGVAVEGFKKDADTDNGSQYNQVGPDYFSVLGVPLIAGRTFTAADRAGAPKVGIVNEAFAKKFNLGRNAVGKRMSLGGDSLDIEIVGLATDAKYSEVKAKVPPVFFLPYHQDNRIGSVHFYLRTSTDMAPVLRAIPSVIRKLDPNLPVEELKTLSQQVRENVSLDRTISTLSAAFAALATLLAAIGLYGVLAYSVAQRTREIGVRMALGANGSRVRRMVLRQVGLMTVVGGVIGLAAALALGRGAQSLLFELQGNDPAVVAIAAVLLGAVALGAGYIPALRASRIDPMQALRRE